MRCDVGTYAAFIGTLTSGNQMDARPVDKVPFSEDQYYVCTKSSPARSRHRSAERVMRERGAEFS